MHDDATVSDVHHNIMIHHNMIHFKNPNYSVVQLVVTVVE
jgi:hypothetical protein